MRALATTWVSRSASDTAALGAALGAALRQGDLVSLTGPLGAGKTVLVRGLAAGAGADSELVRSPTFVLHHVYRGGRVTLHHLDLYRLRPAAGGADGTAPVDIAFLDIDGLLETGAVAVEWGDSGRLPAVPVAHIALAVGDASSRLITLADGAPARIRAAWPETAR